MTVWKIACPSGRVFKDGVEVAGDAAEYLAHVRGGGAVETMEDPQRNVIQINAWQMRRALNYFGLRAAVEQAVAASGDQDLQDGYNHSPTFSSNEPMTLAMGAALGQDDNAMQALFEYGAGT